MVTERVYPYYLLGYCWLHGFDGWSSRPAKKYRRGVEIAYLQRILNDIEHAHLVEDGILGPRTRHALAKLQRKHSLDPDGLPGEKTWAVLKREYGIRV